MRKSTLKDVEAKVVGTPRLGMMIHEAVREAIERAVDEELEASLGAKAYARTEERRGYRNGTRTRSSDAIPRSCGASPDTTSTNSPIPQNP